MQRRIAQRIAHALRLHQRAGGLAVVHQQREFLAAQAAEAVAGAHRALHHPRKMSQRLVAGGVTMAVIDRLEEIDVQQQHHQPAVVTLAAPEFVLQLVHEAAPRVGLRQAVEGQRLLHALGHPGLHQQQQRQEQRRHGHRAADNEEQCPGRGMQHRAGRFPAQAVDQHAQQMQRRQPKDGQQKVQRHAARADLPAPVEDHAGRGAHAHAGDHGKQHDARGHAILSIQHGRHHHDAQNRQGGAAPHLRMQPEELPHAHIDQGQRADPRGIGHHHGRVQRQEAARRVQQQGQHGQRVRQHEGTHARHAAGVKLQQQWHGQRGGQPHIRKNREVVMVFANRSVGPAGLRELLFHWVRFPARVAAKGTGNPRRLATSRDTRPDCKRRYIHPFLTLLLPTRRKETTRARPQQAAHPSALNL